MVDAAKAGRPSPEPASYLMTLCRTFNCTPSQILEEDAELINEMMIYTNTHTAVVSTTSAKGAAIHKLPAGVTAIIEALIKAGVYEGGL